MFFSFIKVGKRKENFVKLFKEREAQTVRKSYLTRVVPSLSGRYLRTKLSFEEDCQRERRTGNSKLLSV